ARSFSLPVVDGVSGAEEISRRGGGGPSAVRVLDHLGGAFRGEEQHGAGTPHPVCSTGTHGGGEQAALLSDPPTSRRPPAPRARDDQQPLLDAVVEVIRVGSLAFIELVEAGAEFLAADRLTDTSALPAVSVAIGRVVELRCKDVETTHRRILAGTYRCSRR